MTPTPPPYWEVVALSSGHALLIERSWSLGDLFTALALLVLAAGIALAWLHELTRGRG